jgi:hypothetical protein
MNYLDTFPTNISEFPICWNKSELYKLGLTSLVSSGFTNIDSHMESILNDFEVINEYNKNNKIITGVDNETFFSIFFRYRILVGSRIFGYVKYGMNTSGMIPYIDMINHSIESNTTWYFDDKLDSFVLVSTCEIPKNQEIVDNYGIKNNVDLFLYYGFTLDWSINPNPIIRLCIDTYSYEFGLNIFLDNFVNADANIIEILLRQK